MKKFYAAPLIFLLLLVVVCTPACGQTGAVSRTTATLPPAGTSAPVLPTTTVPATQTPSPEPTASPTPSTSPTPSPTQQPFSDVNMLFTGDIMYYNTVVQQQKDAATGGYDFTSFFESVAPEIQAADFAIGNLETPIWDVRKSHTNNWRFAAPPEAVRDLKRAGFDVLTTANNHAMDQGLQAVVNTLAVIEGNGLKSAGSYRDKTGRDAFCMMEKDGVKVALFACTQFLNIDQPRSNAAGISMIALKRAKADVQRARKAGADAVIFSVHYGPQYVHDPNTLEKRIVKALRDAGADAVIGSHPHVVQPFLIDPSGEFFAAYSLGNVTTRRTIQDEQFAVLLKLTVRKENATGNVKVTDISYIPTWVRVLETPGGSPKTRVFDLRRALADCEAGTNPLIPKKYLNELKKGMALEKKILGEQYLDPLK